MVTYNTFILDFLGFLYDALHKQCLVEKLLNLINIPDKKSKFSNFQGYETHHPSRGNISRLFSF